MSGDFIKSQWRLLSLAVVLVIGGGAILLWHNYTSPKTVWNDMLVNNLSARSITKSQSASSNGEQDNESVVVQFGPEYSARSYVTVKNSSGAVTTETLATKNAAYLRYTNITEATKKHNFSALVNVWARAANDSTGTQLKQVFNSAILDLSTAPTLPVGYVDTAKRAEMLQYIQQQQVFTPNFKSAQSRVVNGRKVYTYDVTIKLAPYIRLMQAFASVYGIKDLENVSPDQYQSTTLTEDISVDKLSHQMVQATAGSLGFTETYSDFGTVQNVQLPSQTVSVSELQRRFNTIK